MNLPADAQLLIERHQLQPHPEGGWFRETYRSPMIIETAHGPRSACTAIYYLLGAGERSALHRIRSDELWHFHAGAPLEIHAFGVEHRVTRLGLAADCVAQCCVPAREWFGALPLGDYAFVSCTVSPGFDFADFELAQPADLAAFETALVAPLMP